MKRILLDTNVYISAFLFGGKPEEIINLARQKKIKLIISEYILWEIREVLKNKFEVPESRLNMIEHDILSLAEVVYVKSTIQQIHDDPADNAILACALDGKAENIVSGDKHLKLLKKFNNIIILPPAEFLNNL